jgi:hypothetical protein
MVAIFPSLIRQTAPCLPASIRMPKSAQLDRQLKRCGSAVMKGREKNTVGGSRFEHRDAEPGFHEHRFQPALGEFR